MRVTWHPGEALAVISFWHGGTCTASFRLPAPETARLIGVLAGGLADGWQAAPPPSAPPGRFERLRRWLSRRNPSPAVLRLITGGK
jgi:hypothetical protein